MQSRRQDKSMITIELEGNPTTGFTWVYAMAPEGIVREVSNEYIPSNTSRDAVGSGGKFVFVFEAIASGETELFFKYLREWETEIPASKIMIYKLAVDSENNLRLLERSQLNRS